MAGGCRFCGSAGATRLSLSLTTFIGYELPGACLGRFSQDFVLIFLAACGKAISVLGSSDHRKASQSFTGVSRILARRNVGRWYKGISLTKGMIMRRVVLTALAALALVAFTFSGCKKQTPVTPEKKAVTPAGKAETNSSPGQPTTVAPEKSAPAPAEKQAAPAPAAAPTTPAPAEKPAGK